jgi:hypothetical protein
MGSKHKDFISDSSLLRSHLDLNYLFRALRRKYLATKNNCRRDHSRIGHFDETNPLCPLLSAGLSFTPKGRGERAGNTGFILATRSPSVRACAIC